MKHEEKVINDVVHWRSGPDEKWQEYSLQQLGALYMATKAQNNVHKDIIATLEEYMGILKTSSKGRLVDNMLQDLENKRNSVKERFNKIINFIGDK